MAGCCGFKEGDAGSESASPSQAKRRFMQAIKTLAFLRECTIPTLVARMETVSVK